MFPALAGMNRGGLLQHRTELDVPRTGGDEPVSVIVFPFSYLCSPHWRG